MGREMRGGQWQVLSLHRGLLARGVRSVLWCAREGPLYAKARSEDLPVEPLQWRRPGQFDVVHAHDARSHLLASLFTGARIVVARRVAFAIRSGLLSRWKYRRAERYLAVSHYVKKVLVEGGVAPERVAVVYDGVEMPTQPAQGRAIIAPALSDPAKGTDLVQRSAALAGVPVRLSPDLMRDLPTAQLMVYLTRQEGLGSAALLAMAHGVPALASRVGGLPEVVRDGETGILTANEPGQVANALRRLADDSDYCALLGRCGRAMVERDFTNDHMVERTLAQYHEVLGC